MITRTSIQARHALIAPDSHVPSVFPGWVDATGYVMLSPEMGAGLSQMLILFGNTGGTAAIPASGHEHAIYVERGPCDVEAGGKRLVFERSGYVFAPPETALTIHGSETARVTVFRKTFEPHPDLESPPLVHGVPDEVPGEPFLGNPRALLQTLLPVDPRFDLAMNIFTYQPGATLPFIETHIMEHGLLMLSGQGIYRLEDSYYPVSAGDAIWMAPYCPQWFAAIGDEPASYLYTKNIHRLP